MKKMYLVSGALGAALLGASLYANYIMSSQMEGMRKAVSEIAKKNEILTVEAVNAKTMAESLKKTETAMDEEENAKDEAEEKAKEISRILPPESILFTNVYSSSTCANVYFETESALDSETVKVEISPDIPFTTRIERENIRIYADFQPGMKYKITVNDSLRTIDGGKLENDAVADIEIKDLTPEADFVTYGTYLPLNAEKLVIPYKTVNTKEIDVTVYKAYENNLNPYSSQGSAAASKMVVCAKKKILLDTPANQTIYHELDLEDLLGGRKAGVYRIVFDDDENKSYYDTTDQYVYITDMAIQAAEDKAAGKILVFIRTLSTQKPVVNAEVTVLSKKNQVAASGRTDETGCAALTYNPAWEKEADSTLGIIAHSESDMVYFRLDSSGYDTNIKRSAPRAFVFMERGIARPGENVTAGVFVRQENTDGISKPVKDLPLEIEIMEPTGKKFLSKQLKSNEYGFAQTDFAIPETAPTGYYAVHCKAAGSKDNAGRTGIRIASYVPDRIKATGRVLTDNASARDMIDFEFDAKYYFGANVDAALYSYEIISVKTLPATLGTIHGLWEALKAKAWPTNSPAKAKKTPEK